MTEPLKNLYTREVISSSSSAIEKVYAGFDEERFVKLVFSEQWERMELKERMRHIVLCLNRLLPLDYKESISILKKVAPQFSGFIFMLFPDFVEVFGMDEEDESLAALALFTKYSSSEFAIRPFIKRNPEKLMAQMLNWASSENHHLRRLASEGCRPRLPWAMALPEFKKDPTLILPILEKLKDDESEYVRRSVANNLNDISKDHPELVLEIARKWEGGSKNTDWIIRHACRTLLKRGKSEALSHFDFLPPSSLFVSDLNLSLTTLPVGSNFEFTFKVRSENKGEVKVRIEYGIYFMKANGRNSKKIFKISEIKIKQGEEVRIRKKHSFKNLTTRKHYSGNHKVVIVLNGVDMTEREFILTEK